MNLHITVAEDVSLITLANAPSDLLFVASVFEALAAENVNVDMISQSPPTGGSSSLSFTISDHELTQTLRVIAEIRNTCQAIKPIISSANSKLLISGEAMKAPCAAAKVFRLLADIKTDIRLITTAETEISLLITAAEKQRALDALLPLCD